MKKIDVQITKGQIKSFSVELRDDLPEVTASVALFTADNKEITTFSVTTATYCNNNFELPIQMIEPIKEIASRLEAIVMQQCNKALGRIESKEKQTESKNPTEDMPF